METTIALGVLHHTVAVLIVLPTIGKILIRTLSKVILVYKVVSCVIRRINVDHLDFAEIGFLQELQHLKIIALNIEVFGGIKVHAASAAIRFSLTVCPSGNCFIFTNRAQRLIDWGIGEKNGLLLVRPSELVALLIAIHHGAGNLLHQHIFVNGSIYNGLAVCIVSSNCFRHGVGKHRRQLSEIFIRLVCCLHSQFIHILLLS